MVKGNKQFFINASPPSSNWPNGSLALYEISSDEIGRRVGFNAKGEVVRRDSWPNNTYKGMFDSIENLCKAIAELTNS